MTNNTRMLRSDFAFSQDQFYTSSKIIFLWAVLNIAPTTRSGARRLNMIQHDEA